MRSSAYCTTRPSVAGICHALTLGPLAMVVSVGANLWVLAIPRVSAPQSGRGGTLSTGQKHVSIACGLLRDAPILILDEPAAALDPETERGLLDALANACSRRQDYR